MAAVLKGKVDAILLTGGIAYGQSVTDNITDMIDFIAPVKIYPGEDEMRALAMNGLMVLKHIKFSFRLFHSIMCHFTSGHPFL